MRQRFREHRAAAAGVLLAAIFLASCGTRDDNGLGIGFIEDQGQLKAVRYAILAADSSHDYQLDVQPSNAGLSPAIAVGARPGYFARTLIQFGTGALPPPGTTVDSAAVLLGYDGALGDSTTVPVGLHRVTEAWAEVPIAPDSFPAFLAAADTVGLTPIAAGDTLSVSVTSLAQAWVDDPGSNFGMALVPVDSTELFLEYASRNSASPPVLVIHWTTGGGTDSASTSATERDVTVISKTPAFVPLPGQPGRRTVGRGIPSSTLLRFPLPDLGDRVTVNRAVLTVHVDRAMSDVDEFRLRVQRVAEEVWRADTTLVDALVHGLATVTSESDSVQFEVPGLVIDSARDGNFGLVMRAHENRPDVDYFRFYDVGSDSTVVPTLRIWYTPGDAEVIP